VTTDLVATVGRPGESLIAAYGADQQGHGKKIGGVWVLLHAWTVNLWTAFLLGPEGAHITAGYGNWETRERPRQVGLTEWTGQRPYEMTVDALYDGWSNRYDLPGNYQAGAGGYLPRSVFYVDGEIAKLEQLATKRPGMDTPPSLKIFGAVPHAELPWVIQAIDWGDAMPDVETGLRWRQQASIHLVQYVEGDVVVEQPRGAATPKGTRNYKIAKGDNLQKIATKKLGKASRWKEIEKLNKGMRGIKLDPKKFPPGKTIKIPAK
jgi:hypothetical protein